jgi:hypothetical protein
MPIKTISYEHRLNTPEGWLEVQV